MKRRHLLLGRPISESALDGMPRLRPNHNEPYSGEMSDFYNYPHRVFKMLGSDIFFRFFKEKIRTFSEIRGPDAKENEDDDITKMFKALGRLKIKFLDFKPLWNLISSDEGTFEHFVIKTTKILTDRWGYISIFQASNVKNFLLSHPDLLEFHRLLICCDKNQWKKIEYRFLEAHLEERSKGGVVYQDAALKVLSSQVKDDFLKLKEPEEDRFKLPDEYNLDYDESKPFESFTKSVFVFHTVNYLRKHFIGASLEPKISDQISAFSGIFKMFQKALKVQMKIISPEYDNDFRLKDSNAMKLNIEHLRSMMQHHKPTEEPDSNFYLYNVYLDMKSSSIAVISNWVSKIRSAMEEFHDEYRKFTTDWHRTDGHTYLAHNHDHYKDYYKDYVKQIEVQKLRMKDNDRILETVELVYHSKPQKVE
ncbi:hypothetical protein BY996DRAFT_3033670 [Phakopsora pachyrhizi]|nr:hypothetical protein BY996DRAFT_3033670 [Phakopsora pachyrhizi]